jgi:transposase
MLVMINHHPEREGIHERGYYCRRRLGNFQLHGAAVDGSVVFRKKLSRTQLLAFLAKLPACTVAMEACATSHHWGREIGKLGHAVRLIPPIYVKPFVKRQKNDAADALAIAEAASRPTMRFVAVKTEEQQSRAMIFRTRDLLVRQRTQLINALRGHLAEYGVVTAQGIVNARRLQAELEDPETGLPPIVCDIGRTYLDPIAGCSAKIAELEMALRAEAARRAKRRHVCRPCQGSGRSAPWRSRPSRRR